jgi:hypothetical protein
MRNVTSQMIEDAEAAYYRAAGESCRISGIRAALHTVPTVKLDDVNKICLRTALEALIELSRQRNENCDHIVANVEQLITDVESLS